MSGGYHVIFSRDAGCYTVGSGQGDEWAPESDHEFRDDADRRAFFLNHGRDMDDAAPAFAPRAPAPVVDPWDLFAAAALSGFLASHTESTPPADKTAKWVAEYADSMMAERAKRNGGGK